MARIASYGARVVQTGATYAEALAASRDRQAETGALEVHAYDHPDVLAGQGTVGREFEQDAPDLTHVLVATGGGGLIGGIAAWYAGSAKVISVEPEGCPDAARRAAQPGRPVEARWAGWPPTASARARSAALMFPIAQAYVAAAVLVPDAAIAAAQRADRGTGCAWSPNRAARRRWRRCCAARSRRPRAPASACWCAAPTPIPRRLSDHERRTASCWHRCAAASRR